MNTEHDEQEQVRRLLAAAAGPDPEHTKVPGDVAERLDDVLADLVSERAEAPVTATEERGTQDPGPDHEVTGVTELAPRRRRRWPQLLLAAAAVSVIALGVGIDDLTGGQGDASTSAESVATRDNAAGGVGAEPERLEARSPEDAGSDRDLSTPLPQAASDFPRLRTSSLRADVQRVADFSLTAARSEVLRRSGGCALPDTEGGDEWLPVRLDGESAVLVLRAPAGGRRTAEVFTCEDADTPAASTTIEAREP